MQMTGHFHIIILPWDAHGLAILQRYAIIETDFGCHFRTNVLSVTLFMTYNLPSTKTKSVELPPAAWEMGAQLVFLMGRISVAYENRAWARSKVKSVEALIQAEKIDGTESHLLNDQLRDRQQVLLSMERYYKKLRCEFRDHFPEQLSVLESMIPGSTKGLDVKTKVPDSSEMTP